MSIVFEFATHVVTYWSIDLYTCTYERPLGTGMKWQRSYSKWKPHGWRGESHRHYLAAKGVKTKSYFVRDYLKGNRDSGAVKSLYAQGYSKDEAYRLLGLPVPEKRKSRPIIDVPDRDEVSVPEAQFPSQVVSEPLPVEPVPEERPANVRTIENMEPSEPVATTESPGNVTMTPGVPPPPMAGFNIL